MTETIIPPGLIVAPVRDVQCTCHLADVVVLDDTMTRRASRVRPWPAMARLPAGHVADTYQLVSGTTGSTSGPFTISIESL